ATNIIAGRNGIKTYKVQKGDTISGIAARFGISLDTLKWANPGIRSFLNTGDALTIPPVDGVIYEVRSGDSFESITKRYRVDAALVVKYNPEYQKLFDKPGAKVVLSYAKQVAYAPEKNLPAMARYFALPARGWNWGALHYNNAVDIADNCGSPIYASAEGLVTEVSDEGYWNDGYGNLVVVEHPNGTKTRYAHTEKSLVKIGDYVSQGEKIATIGNTGNTHGPTGCHLHFEVEGAQNPFALR
ncbi:MAG: peptidoglycan DD-metalloendopeptidase family protein, partial [Patescibacteria group bacterium]